MFLRRNTIPQETGLVTSKKSVEVRLQVKYGYAVPRTDFAF